MTSNIAALLIRQFVGATEEFGRTEIWSVRCKVTVEWEKTQGITAREKKAGVSKGGKPTGFGPPRRQAGLLEQGLREADERVVQYFYVAFDGKERRLSHKIIGPRSRLKEDPSDPTGRVGDVEGWLGTGHSKAFMRPKLCNHRHSGPLGPE